MDLRGPERGFDDPADIPQNSVVKPCLSSAVNLSSLGIPAESDDTRARLQPHDRSRASMTMSSGIRTGMSTACAVRWIESRTRPPLMRYAIWSMHQNWTFRARCSAHESTIATRAESAGRAHTSEGRSRCVTVAGHDSSARSAGYLSGAAAAASVFRGAPEWMLCVDAGSQSHDLMLAATNDRVRLAGRLRLIRGGSGNRGVRQLGRAERADLRCGHPAAR
jgi:hypothetical protein